MASKAVRRQMVVIGFVEGFVNMMWDQLYSTLDDASEDKIEFIKIKNKIIPACTKGFALLASESNNILLNEKEYKKILGQIDQMRIKEFQNNFKPMHAISYVIDIINTQFSLIKINSPKYRMFENIWEYVRELEMFFDSESEYEGTVGLETSEAFEALTL